MGDIGYIYGFGLIFMFLLGVVAGYLIRSLNDDM